MEDKTLKAEDSPYISVIITAYNRKEFILKGIKSVLNQTLDKKYYEIIVIKNFKDEKIDDFIEKNNVKGVVSDEKLYKDKVIEALDIAKGNVISFLDDDDLFTKDKLEVVYNKFKDNPNLVYYHNDNIHINEGYKNIDKEFNQPGFNMSSISIKRNILNLNNLKGIKWGMDPFMYLSALESGKDMISGNEKLTYYMYHNSISHLITTNLDEFKNDSIKASLAVIKGFIYFKEIFNSKKSLYYIKGKLAEEEIIYYTFKGEQKPDHLFDIFKDKDLSFKLRFTIFSAYILSKIGLRDLVEKRAYDNYIKTLNKL